MYLYSAMQENDENLLAELSDPYFVTFSQRQIVTGLEEDGLLEDSDGNIVDNEEYTEGLNNIVDKLEQLQVNEKKSRGRRDRVRDGRARGNRARKDRAGENGARGHRSRGGRNNTALNKIEISAQLPIPHFVPLEHNLPYY
ncbi:1821_t:CDS:1 [Acaulospora morrowiae]|uniref:1821_t:CDS:1 n=1 Tax=Acaulospora morrowiae TaxID=94023 RepID=A0A9N8VPD1_9GLOM|nr:1821_t:CDS:1 [Acaulospora morrowiae]